MASIAVRLWSSWMFCCSDSFLVLSSTRTCAATPRNTRYPKTYTHARVRAHARTHPRTDTHSNFTHTYTHTYTHTHTLKQPHSLCTQVEPTMLDQNQVAAAFTRFGRILKVSALQRSCWVWERESSSPAWECEGGAGVERVQVGVGACVCVCVYVNCMKSVNNIWLMCVHVGTTQQWVAAHMQNK
jgi:hypothetical protein